VVCFVIGELFVPSVDKKLSSMMKILSGKPLYLDNYQLQLVLKAYPKLFNDPSLTSVRMSVYIMCLQVQIKMFVNKKFSHTGRSSVSS